MRPLLSALILAGLIGLPTVTRAAEKDPAEGLWLTQNERSVIKISPCYEDSLCGHVYWIIKDGMQYDSENPDKTKRDTPMCGLPIMWGFDRDGLGDWEDGKIYKADEGDMYDADIKVLEDGTLKVRGYMGFSFLGKTQIWHRVRASDYKQCKAPAPKPASEPAKKTCKRLRTCIS